MELINMKCDPKEKEIETSTLGEDSEYPYELQLTLDSESLQKLGISEAPKVGSTFMMLAQVEVSSVSQYESQEKENKMTVNLQITDMNLKKSEPDPKSHEEIFYGKS